MCLIKDFPTVSDFYQRVPHHHLFFLLLFLFTLSMQAPALNEWRVSHSTYRSGMGQPEIIETGKDVVTDKNPSKVLKSKELLAFCLLKTYQ